MGKALRVTHREWRAWRGLEAPRQHWSWPISSLGPPTDRCRGQLQSGVWLGGMDCLLYCCTIIVWSVHHSEFVGKYLSAASFKEPSAWIKAELHSRRHDRTPHWLFQTTHHILQWQHNWMVESYHFYSFPGRSYLPFSSITKNIFTFMLLASEVIIISIITLYFSAHQFILLNTIKLLNVFNTL